MGLTVFLDLDGTLNDAAPGIVAAMGHALDALGVPHPGETALTRLVGPALQETFPALGVKDVDAAIALYRDHYRGGGMLDAQVYAGVPEMLDALRDMGADLHLATAKPIAYAADITAHFGLSPHLTQQFGSELDGRRTDKRDLLAHALEQTGAAPGDSFMLGDRRHDAIGALANGITPLGALWGYGDRAELTDAGAHIAESPAQVAPLIKEILDARRSG